MLVKGQNITQNDKKLCLSHSISQEWYIIYCDFWYTFIKWWYPQQIFSFFKILILSFFRRLKGQNMAKSYQFQYVLLYISGILDHIKILITISAGVFLYFFSKNQHVLKSLCFYWPTSTVFFNNYLFFKFINKCQKEIQRCVPHFLHICVIF